MINTSERIFVDPELIGKSRTQKYVHIDKYKALEKDRNEWANALGHFLNVVPIPDVLKASGTIQDTIDYFTNIIAERKTLEARVQELEAVVQDFAPVQPDGTKEHMPHKVRRLSLRVNELEASALRIANIKLWLDEQGEECDAEALDDLSRLLWQNKGLQKKKRNHV